METAWHDLHYAARNLAKNRTFAVAALCTLALGIGSATTIFSIVNSVMFPSLPYSDPARLVGMSPGPSISEFVAWKDKNDVFDELAAWRMASQMWSDQSEPEDISGLSVTANLFRVAGVRPFLGRDFDVDADRPGRGNVVILGYSLWQQRYSGDRDIINKNLTLNGKPFTVIGVMPSNRGFPSATVRYWIPWVIDEDPGRLASGNTGFRVVGRLKPGMSLNLAQAAMNQLARQLTPQSAASKGEPGLFLQPAFKEQNGKSQFTVMTLFGAVLLVLLIACVNLANLILARASVREKDVAVRAALGAARSHLVRYLLTESLLLSFLGGGLGLLLSYWGVRTFIALKAPGIPGPSEVGLEPPVLAFALGASVITAFLFGLLPALHASKPDLVELLKQGGRISVSSWLILQLQPAHVGLA